VRIFLAHTSKDVELAVALSSELTFGGHEVVDPFAVRWGEPGLSEISRAIRSADLVVTILSGGNANVLYELGLAVGSDRPVVIAAASPEDVPFDAASVPFAVLTGNARDDASEIARHIGTIPTVPSRLRALTGTAEENLRTVAHDSSALASLRPGDLERLLVAFLGSQDFDVQLPGSRLDEGYDFAVVAPATHARLLVEVKSYREHSRVSVEAVRRLAEAAQGRDAAGGLMISTSQYSPAAMAFAASNRVVLMTLEEVLEAQAHDRIRGLATRSEVGQPQAEPSAPPVLLELTRAAAYETLRRLGGGDTAAELIADSVASYVDLSWHDPEVVALSREESKWRRYINQVAVRHWLYSLREPAGDEAARSRQHPGEQGAGSRFQHSGPASSLAPAIERARTLMVDTMVARGAPRDDAEDAAQDAVERMVRDPNRFAERLANVDAEAAYFTTVAFNAYLIRLRTERRRRERELRAGPALAESALAENLGLARPGIGQDAIVELARDAGLTPRQMEYLLAVLNENRSVSDVAAAASSSPQAVQAVLRRAVHRLRIHLESADEADVVP